MLTVDEKAKRAEVLQKVQAIVRAELDDPSLLIAEDTAVSALPDWDSVAHFRIIIAIENEFEILFELEEHTEFETIGDVIACICQKLPQVVR
jgi:acyl carrier protein